MKTIATDDTNDLYIDAGGNIAILSDTDALANILKNAVLTNSGELSYNKQKGIPYMETVFTDRVNTDIFQSYVIQVIESVDGVERVSAFSHDIKDGVYSYTVEVETDFGTVVLNG